MIKPYKIADNAVFGDILPNGTTVFSVIGQPKIVLNDRIIDAPYEMMFNRLSNDGRVAAKANIIGHAWIYDGSWHDTGRDSTGVQAHGWNPDGTLAILSGAPDQESQGLRFYDPSLPAYIANLDVTHQTPGWVTGSPSYGPQSPLSQSLGIGVYAWTRSGDVVVGQGQEGGAVIEYRGQQYVLEYGDTQFIQLHRDGDKLAIAITKLLERRVMFFLFNVNEITSLPLYSVAQPTTPIPVPEPPTPSEPAPMPEAFKIPEELIDQRQTVIEARNRLFPPDKYIDDPDELATWAKEIAKLLKLKYPHLPIGLAKAKGGSDNHGGPTPSVPQGFTTDIIAISNGAHWDFKADGGRESDGAVFWNLEQNPINYPPIADRFVPIENIEGWGNVPTTGGPKEPPVVVADPPADDQDQPDYDALLELVIEKVAEAVRPEILAAAAEIRGDIASFREELKNLSFEGRHRLLGTMTFTRKS